MGIIEISYDPSVDALYVRLADAAIIETVAVSHDLIVDYGANGGIAGVEVLDARQRLTYGFAARMAAALAFPALRPLTKSR